MDLFCDCFRPPDCMNTCRKYTKKCAGSQATPLPKLRIFVVLSIGFGNVFGSVVIFPLLPFMVQDFFPHLSKEELGQQAGYLGSAYFIGNFAGSMAWGWLSDAWGRRPTLLLGCIGTAFASLLFGFSENFAMAVAARFLWGLLNGNFGIAKTYLSEILDDSNQAKGFATFGMGSGLGRIFGSVVGGFLSQPASKYSVFENAFFCKYQYVLPIFVNVAIYAVSFIGIFLVVEETLRLKPKTDNSSQGNNNSDNDSDTTNIEMISMNDDNDTDVTSSDNDETIKEEEDFSDVDALLENSNTTIVQVQPAASLTGGTHYDSCYYPFTHFGQFQKQQCIECCLCCLSSKDGHGTTLFNHNSVCKLLSKVKNNLLLRLRLVWDRRVILAVVTYGFVGGVTILSNEIYPLLLVTDHDHGGYNMDDNEIAVFIMISGVVLLFYQAFVFSRISKVIGYRNLLRISLVVFAVGNFLLPWANRITGPIDNDNTELYSGSGGGIVNGSDIISGYCKLNNSQEASHENSIKRFPVEVWIVMVIVTLMTILGRISSLVTLVVIVNNSAVTETRGTVNGLGQSLLAIFRAFTPALGSIAFAWSEKAGLGFPLNYHLTFELCAVFSLAIVGFTFCFPKSIEKKRTA